MARTAAAPEKRRSRRDHQVRIKPAGQSGRRENIDPANRFRRLIPMLGFMAVALALYAIGLRGGFVWDDDNYVRDNIQLRTAGGLWRIWTQLGATAQYYPLVFTSFWLEYHLWGESTPGYHLVNVLLHGASAGMLFLILRRMKPALAFPVALLFVAHPVMVESVQWITERKNTLCLFFALSSLYALLPLILEAEGRLDWRRYAGALLLFTCAMLSKTVACSLPAVVLVLCWYVHGRGWVRRIVPMLPFFAIGAALAAVTVYTERHIVGTAIQGSGLTPLQRIMVAGRALWFYAAKLVWPWPTMFIYPKWNMAAASTVQLSYALLAVTVMIAAWATRHRIGRGLASLLFIYAGVLTPALGFVDVYPFKFSFVADHFQYLAAPAFLCVIVSALLWVFQRMKFSAEASRYAFVGIACVLGLLTVRQVRAYDSAESLYGDTIAKNPAAAMPHNNLGQILAKQGKLDEAEKQYRAAIESDPNFAGALFNLGEILLRTGRAEEARSVMDRAVAADAKDARLRLHMGLAYARQKDADTAIRYFNESAALKPDFIDPVLELGNVYAQTGHPDLAAEQFSKAIAMREDHPLAQANYANALASQGRMDDALPHYRRALDLNPADAQTWQNYAVTLERMGRTSESTAARQTADALRNTSR